MRVLKVKLLKCQSAADKFCFLSINNKYKKSLIYFLFQLKFKTLLGLGRYYKSIYKVKNIFLSTKLLYNVILLLI